MPHAERMATLNWAGWRVLRIAASGLAAMAFVSFAIIALRDCPAGTPVWVTAREYSFGEAVLPEDLEIVAVPPAAVPARPVPPGTTGPFKAGRPLGAHTILSEADLLGSERSAGLRRSEALVEILLPESSGAHVVEGEVADLWGLGNECEYAACPPELLSAGARVIQVLEVGGSNWAGEAHRSLALAIPSADTGKVLFAAQNGSLTFAVRPAGG